MAEHYTHDDYESDLTSSDCQIYWQAGFLQPIGRTNSVCHEQYRYRDRFFQVFHILLDPGYYVQSCFLFPVSKVEY